jgi:hypothetical protein
MSVDNHIFKGGILGKKTSVHTKRHCDGKCHLIIIYVKGNIRGKKFVHTERHWDRNFHSIIIYSKGEH